MKSFLPSLLGRGEESDRGLAVRATGLGSRCKRPPGLGSAQICPLDWKTKFPSAVHPPQHSSGGSCQPGSNRCRFAPLADTSHRICWPRVPALSVVSNRRWSLSGDQTTFLMSPPAVSSLRGLPPSALET